MLRIAGFSLTHDIVHGIFDAIERSNLESSLAPLPCQSHRDKCFFETHVVFVCHFVL